MQTIPPPGAVPPPVPVPPLPPPQRPAPVRSRSTLGRLTLSLALFAAGIIALIDLAGARVPASVYLAVPLGVVAAGLLVGARYGRARALIGVGAVLSVLLGITVAAEGHSWTSTRESVTWRPAGIAQVQPTYSIDAGNAVLDLSRLDFSGQTMSVAAHVSMGNLTVILPSTVDVDVRATVEIGDATVLGQEWSGIGQSQHTIADNGADGPGGGTLAINATVNVGNLEVRR
jgi:Cell wall-active antibiotics response LiaF, C-terminal